MIFDIDDIQALISKEYCIDNCLDLNAIKKVTTVIASKLEGYVS